MRTAQIGPDLRLGHPLRRFGHPLPKTLVIWASRITLAIWVRFRARVTGDAHITRVLGRGCPKRGEAHITVTALPLTFLVNMRRR